MVLVVGISDFPPSLTSSGYIMALGVAFTATPHRRIDALRGSFVVVVVIVVVLRMSSP